MSIERKLELTMLLMNHYNVPLKLINELRKELAPSSCLICEVVAAGREAVAYASESQHDMLSGHRFER